MHIRGSVIGSQGAYTVIVRNQAIEFYATGKGPWEKRTSPDFLLTPDETADLFDFLLVVLPQEYAKTTVFEM